MFMAERNVGLAEYAITRAIPELQAQSELISYTDIAEHIGCGYATVHRSVKRLLDAGTLIRVYGSTRNGGYRYTIPEQQ